MSDPRYKRGLFQGHPPTFQQGLNHQLDQMCVNHPSTYGWSYTGQQPDCALPVYEKEGVKLMRHPAGDCWLVQWLGRCYRSEVHVSQLSVEMLKNQIELDIARGV
jgi:hypothetical protein